MSEKKMEQADGQIPDHLLYAYCYGPSQHHKYGSLPWTAESGVTYYDSKIWQYFLELRASWEELF